MTYLITHVMIYISSHTRTHHPPSPLLPQSPPPPLGSNLSAPPLIPAPPPSPPLTPPLPSSHPPYPSHPTPLTPLSPPPSSRIQSVGPTGHFGSEGQYGLVLVGAANVQNCNRWGTQTHPFDILSTLHFDTSFQYTINTPFRRHL